METNNENKVLVGFKCSPSLRLTLCEQADNLGVTLSSHVETLVSSQEYRLNEAKKLATQIKALKETLAFYENAFLTGLHEEFKGKTVTYKNRAGEKINLTIKNIQDVYTIVINSFKTTK